MYNKKEYIFISNKQITNQSMKVISKLVSRNSWDNMFYWQLCLDVRSSKNILLNAFITFIEEKFKFKHFCSKKNVAFNCINCLHFIPHSNHSRKLLYSSYFFFSQIWVTNKSISYTDPKWYTSSSSWSLLNVSI